MHGQQNIKLQNILGV